MYKFLIVLFLSVVWHIPAALAHPGGHGEAAPISKNEVIPIASDYVAQLIDQGVELKGIGKLNKAWGSIPKANKAAVENSSGHYVVSFAHPKEEKKLYLLISPTGDLYDVNFSGEFKGL